MVWAAMPGPAVPLVRPVRQFALHMQPVRLPEQRELPARPESLVCRPDSARRELSLQI